MASATRLLALLALAVPTTLWAAVPPSGTLTDSATEAGYSAGPFFAPNPTPILFVDQGPECFNPEQPCDDYALTVTLSSTYKAAHPNAAVKVTLGWDDTGSGASDYDLYIYKGTVINTDGSQPADYQSAGGANPEVATISPLVAGSATYTVKIVPYTPSAETVTVHLELLPGGASGGSFGGADPTIPGVPRYQTFYAPTGSSAESSDGEFNIGYNPKTGRIMTMNIGPIWRLTPGERLSPALPESCDAQWEDRTALSTFTGVDPILWTDQKSGRTLASNSTVGANAVFAWSDNDGDLWVPLSISPINGGTDHETIGSGPYPASLSALPDPLNQGEAVYYCSQTWPLGPAACQRSDTLGASFGPGVLAYQGNGVTQCSGIHGHVRVAPNGTVWLPVRDCAGEQGGAVSTDAGNTWTEFAVRGSRAQSIGADPSIAIDSDNNAYYCYVNDEPLPPGEPPEGHVHVKVSGDGGVTWVNDFDLGAFHGIKNAVHPEAIGGSSGRAACGFIGTNVAGDYQALGFQGVWYAFIATTYDFGATWTTVNASPNDPVQRASGIWQAGGSHQNRNLLDFNEITVDDQGHALYGYSDGCVSADCVDGTAANDFVAFMRVARQSGGKSLFASKDTQEPAAPKRACLAGTRGPASAQLSWKAPDNGGADISSYQVLRGTSPGTETLIGSTLDAKTSYLDSNTDPNVTSYYYVVKAINANGTGATSNEVNLRVVQPPPEETACSLPGLTKLTDANGDTSAVLGIVTTPAPPGADLLSFQLSQPYVPPDANGVAQPIKLVFTISTDNGQSPQPIGSAWYVAMKIADPAPAITFRYRGVHMAWNGPTPTFESYTPGANNAGGVDGRFVVAGSTRPAQAGSHYSAPFDQIVIVVNAGDLGLNPGDTISGFVSGVSQTAANVATALYDQMPDSLTFSGSYTVASNQFCRPNSPPVVTALSATPDSGPTPLTVHFVASAHDTDTEPPADTIASYRFNFGDGTDPVTQAGSAVDHVYNGASTYVASVTATDSRGAQSYNTNVAITVTPQQMPDLTVAKTHSGNFTQGQKGATYTITVTNSGGGPTTTAQVSVVDTLPAGLNATGISGNGWNCNAKPKPTCSTSSVRAPGFVYPPITLTVNVAGNAAASVTNKATVSGGGESNTANNTATDATTITPKK